MIISYVIAGFLMLTILGVNQTVSNSNQELTSSLIKNTHTRAVADVLESDFPKIGYEQKGVINPDDIFLSVTNHIISFRSDLDNDGDIEIITWEFDPDKTPEHANNPHVSTLTRTVENEATGAVDATEIQMGVTNFEVFYYDEYGKATPLSHPVSPTDVRQIEVKIELQSDFQLSSRPEGASRYMVTKWQKRFSPVNLRPK